MSTPQPCARCGHDADFHIASMWLCVNCYHLAGSTCAGIGVVPRPTGSHAEASQRDPVC